MVLDPKSREIVERLIDRMISDTPALVKDYRERKSQLHIEEESDFVYGMAFGKVHASMLAHFVSVLEREPTREEMNEVNAILSRRALEIRAEIRQHT